MAMMVKPDKSAQQRLDHDTALALNVGRLSARMIVALKASGGYKYRKALRMMDSELDAYVERAASSLVQLLVAQVIAGQMLHESGRTEEYAERVRLALHEARNVLGPLAVKVAKGEL
jgi:hypothetical protein